MGKTTEVLTGYKVPPAVLALIENAEHHLLLASAYVSVFPHLEHTIKTAKKRGIPIHCVVREPDGSKREKDKKKQAMAALEKLGVQIHIVKRLHAKVYISESEAIITSFNLVGASQDSVEFGIRITDPDTVRECYKAIEEYTEGLDLTAKSKRAPSKKKSVKTADADGATGFCIGCADDTHPFNAEKPLCLKCYRKSKKATDFDLLSDRVCHRCGKANKSTVEKPLCYKCYKSLADSG